MKKYIPQIIALCLLPIFATAQQQALNTQFMYYKLGYNPAFAGSQDVPTLSAIFRQQWVGLEGAPSIQALTFNMPLANQRVGVGANLYRHTIGITSMINLDAAYAYRVRLGNGMLGIGVQGSIRQLSQDFNQTVAVQSKDQDLEIPGNNESRVSFNFGTGLYYNSDQFYFGVSAPRLLANDLDFGENRAVVSREVQHFYLMTGYTIPMTEGLNLQPQVLLRYVDKAPVDADVNVNLLIQDMYIAGLTYRFGGDKAAGKGESIALLLAAQLGKSLMFGLSFDYTLSEVSNYTTGSIEASVHYRIGAGNSPNDFVNPRFF